ncbi:MAG TPA: S1C family serine protease [Caulobacteraceae bacterium]|jgi:S1-C subfamily serine protease
MSFPFDGLEVDEELRPLARLFDFDLIGALSAVVALEARVPQDAHSARSLGAERIGNATVIGPEGLALTMGYLVMEAEQVTLITAGGRRVDAHVLGVDQATGLALVHALEPLNLPTLRIGDSHRLRGDDAIVSAGGGGPAHALSSRLIARAPFAGYWEYYLDEALYVAPAHPHWSGSALIGPSGELVGVGSLFMEHRGEDGETAPLNMFVPAELLPPILDDLSRGRPGRTPRPWLGLISQESQSRVVVADVTPGGPAARAELRRGDVIHRIAGEPITDLAGLYHRLWALGPPGVTVPLTLQRGREVFDMEIRSADRTRMLRKQRLN